MWNIINDNTILWLCILLASVFTIVLFLFLTAIIWIFRKKTYSNALHVKIFTSSFIFNVFWLFIFNFIPKLATLFSILPSLSLTIFYIYFLSSKYWKENSIYIFISSFFWNILALMMLMFWLFQKNWI